jgi:hypothetical protein
MCVQSIPYVSAVLASLVSALPIPARWIGQGYMPVEGGEEYAQLVPDPLDRPAAAAAAGGAVGGALPTYSEAAATTEHAAPGETRRAG